MRRVEFNGPGKFPESDNSRCDDSFQEYQEFKHWSSDREYTPFRCRNEKIDDGQSDHKHRRLMFRE